MTAATPASGRVSAQQRSVAWYLAGSFIMMLSVLTVISTLLSDLLLAWLDPRIRHS